MRPASDSESFGIIMTFADPVRRYRPGRRWRSTSYAATSATFFSCGVKELSRLLL